MQIDRKLAALWLLFVLLLTIFLVLVYFFYVLVLAPKPAAKADSRLLHVASIYGFGKSAEDLFNRPHDVCVDREGNLIVSDTRNSRVVKITPGGRLIRIYKDRFVVRPLGVSVAGNGSIYVADRFSGALVIFDPYGGVKRRLSVSGPLKPCVYEDRVYLATKESVAVLSLRGDFLFHFGSYGREEGMFSFPNGLSVDRERIYVADTNNQRVQCFTRRGELLWSKGSPGTKNGGSLFSLPAGIIYYNGKLYVVDGFADAILMLDAKTGKLIKKFGGKKGDADGEFNQPTGIDHLEKDLFVVADKYNDRIQLVRLPIDK